MGDCYQTCYLSKLPIIGGERFVLIPLVATKYARQIFGLTYTPLDAFVQCGLPIRGECDGYSGYKPESVTTHPANKLFFEQLGVYKPIEEDSFDKEKLLGACENKLTPMTYSHLIGTVDDYLRMDKKDISCFGDFAGFVNDLMTYNGSHYIKENRFGGNRLLTYIAVHEELYDRIVKTVSPWVSYFNKPNARQRRIDKIKEAIVLKKAIMKIKNDDEREHELLMNELADIYNCKLRFLPEFAPTMLQDFIMAKLEDNMDESLLNEYVDLLLFEQALSSSRNGYLVTSGLGSQNRESEIQRLIAEFIIEKTNESEEE